MTRVRRILLELCQWAALGAILILVVYGDRRSCQQDGNLYQSVRDCALAPMQRFVADFDGASAAGVMTIRGLASEQLGDAVRARADFEAALAAHLEGEAGAAPLRFLVRHISERVATTGLARLAKSPSVPSVTTHGAPSSAVNLPVEIVPPVGHISIILHVAFSPDGTQVLSSSGDGTLKLWDTTTGRLIRTFGHGGLVHSVAFSPDGKLVLSGSDDNTLKLWDAATGQLSRTFEGHGASVDSVAFSPDGRTLLSGSEDQTLKLWDAATGGLIRTFEDGGSVDSVAFSPDGTQVLSGSGGYGGLKLWNAATGELIRTFERHGLSLSSGVFSPDGRRVLSSSSDKTLKLWDAATGRLIHTFEDGNSVDSVAFSPDGKQVLSGGDGGLKLWHVATGKLVRAFEGHDGPVTSVAFSPDGTQVLSGDNGGLKLWNAATGGLIRPFVGHGGFVSSVAFSPDGRQVLSGGDGGLKLWNAATGGLIRPFMGHGGFVSSVAFSPDGRQVLSGNDGTDDKTLKLWDAATGQLNRAFEGQASVDSVAFSPDGRQVLSGGYGGLKLWDAATGGLIRPFEEHAFAHSVAFSPDGKQVLSGSGDNTLRLWDVATGRLIRTFRGHVGPVISVAFSASRKHVLSGSQDGTLKLWEAATGELIRTFEAHSSVSEAAFSPDGVWIVAGLPTGTIKVWRAETRELLASFLALPDGEWITITPEGFFDASKGGAQALTVVRGLEVYSIDQFYQALHRPDLVRDKLAGDPQGEVREAAAKLDLAKVVASGPAPRVAITTPKAGATVAEEQITGEALIADQGGGIGKVEWRVNGTTLGLEQRGLGPEATAGTTVSVRSQLPLEPGDNRIEIVAYNAKGLIASEPVGVTVKWTGEGPSMPPRLYVLAVGVNDYWDSRLRLNFAAPDANAMGEALRQAGAGLYERVEVTTVLDADATNVNLDRVFNELAKQIRPRDVFVFFLAGHGKTIDGRYYFLPYDFRYQGEESFAAKGVGQDRWQEWFARIPARKSVLLYDTGESGSLTGARVAKRGTESYTAIEKLTRAVGRTVLSASTDDTPALEGYRGHGVFTYVALDALGQAHANAEGLIGVTDLAGYIDEKVPELSSAVFKMRQVPQMNIVGSNFPLVHKTVVLPSAATEPPTAVPAKPTHVIVTTTARVREAPKASAPVVIELTAGTQVQVVETAEGWLLVARDGKMLGYVEKEALARLQ